MVGEKNGREEIIHVNFGVDNRGFNKSGRVNENGEDAQGAKLLDYDEGRELHGIKEKVKREMDICLPTELFDGADPFVTREEIFGYLVAVLSGDKQSMDDLEPPNNLQLLLLDRDSDRHQEDPLYGRRHKIVIGIESILKTLQKKD